MIDSDATYWFYEYIEPRPRPGITGAGAGDWIARQNFRLGVAGFQEAVGLNPDGVLGPDTVAAVGEVIARGGRLSENFHLDEFRCTHCGRARVNSALVQALERLRARVGPLGKDSSYRCEQHQESLINPRSMHILGCAWDPLPDPSRANVAGCGFSGIGVAHADANRVTHIDVRHASADNPGGTPSNPAVFQDN